MKTYMVEYEYSINGDFNFIPAVSEIQASNNAELEKIAEEILKNRHGAKVVKIINFNDLNNGPSFLDL